MRNLNIVYTVIITSLLSTASAQESSQTDTDNKRIFSQLSLGGYGEANYSRNFYSDSPFRYMKPESHRNDPDHGRFDLPHVVFFVGYEFGHGWRMNSEIEFEHGGTESAMEAEAEEGGEYEAEVERGGEVVLEQFWIEKTISRAFNIRAGHIIVPVGYINGNHLPTQFFTAYRPVGENTIIPCTWHETGISVWGRIANWRYEAMLLPGLDSELFGNDTWVGDASASPYEFKIANKPAGLLRIDNYSIRGLRMGLTGYYGHSFTNSLMPSYADKYKQIKGAVAIGSFDFYYNDHNCIARGSVVYGHLGDAQTISLYNRNLPNQSPSPRTNIATEAVTAGVEAGYNVAALSETLRTNGQKLYVFGRYDYYDSMYKTSKDILDEQWCGRQTITAGINYYPLSDIVVKAEYAAGLLKSPFNDERSVTIGIAYAGFFR
jgi:hypothetical protein